MEKESGCMAMQICVFSVLSEEQQLPVHKATLAANSPTFARIFASCYQYCICQTSELSRAMPKMFRVHGGLCSASFGAYKLQVRGPKESKGRVWHCSFVVRPLFASASDYLISAAQKVLASKANNTLLPRKCSPFCG